MATIEVVKAVGALLIPIVVAMVRHYGRKAQAENRRMREDITRLMERSNEQCQTARKAYKLLRKEQHALRAQITPK